MRDIKLAIKQFEAIDSLQVVFKNGFTCITGESNQGKSALFRAIQNLLYNKHSDDSVQWGKDFYMVGLEVDGQKVICKRNPNQGMKTSYNVNNKTLTKVGRNNLPEVDEALNMQEVDIAGSKVCINMTPQFAYPFMLNLSPGKLYTFLSQSSNQDDLYQVLKGMKSDLRDIDDKRKKLEGVVELAKDTYNKEHITYNNLNGSDFVVEAILNLQSQVTYLNTLDTIINRLTICDTSMVNIDMDLISIRRQLDVLSDLDNILSELDSLEDLRGYMSTIKGKLIEFNDVRQSLSILDKSIEELNIEPIEKSIKELDTLANQNKALSNKIEAIENKTILASKYEEELRKVNISLQDNKSLDALYTAYNESDIIVKDFRAHMSKIDAQLNEINKTDVELASINQSLEDIINELNEFKVCPTCGKEF